MAALAILSLVLLMGGRGDGWRIFVSSHPEDVALIYETPSFNMTRDIALEPPRTRAGGSFEGTIRAGQVASLVFDGPPNMTVQVDFKADGLDPLSAECRVGQAAGEEMSHGLGDLEVNASGSSCSFRLSLQRELANERGNEIVWDTTHPDGAGASGVVRFAASLERP